MERLEQERIALDLELADVRHEIAEIELRLEEQSWFEESDADHQRLEELRQRDAELSDQLGILTAEERELKDPQIGVLNGLGTGAMAFGNAAADTAVGLVTLGTYDSPTNLFGVPDPTTDIGYNQSYVVNRVASEFLVGAGTGGLANAAKGTRFAAAGTGLFAWDVAGNVSGTTMGVVNGDGWQIAGGVVGLGGNSVEAVADGLKSLRASRPAQIDVPNTGCFAAGTLVWINDTSDSSPVSQVPRIDDRATASQLAVLDRPAGISTIAIESVPLGSRVPSRNPRWWERDHAFDDPKQATWRRIEMTVWRSDGTAVEVELLRPQTWIEQHRLEPGRRVEFTSNEQSLRGIAQIHAVEPCPAIASGTGAVVVGRAATLSPTDVIDVRIDSGTTIRGTATHAIWSATKNDWVGLGELEPGELVSIGDDNTAAVLSVEETSTPERVYNLEIHGEHVYQIGRDGILVHNFDCQRLMELRLKEGQGNLTAAEAAELNQLEDAAPRVAMMLEKPDYSLDDLPEYNGGKTTGNFFGGESSRQLTSGYDGPSADLPLGTPGMNGNIKSHVEAHSAAIMRQDGLAEATLVINRMPCPGKWGCNAQLHRMLPEGGLLRIIGPDGFDKFYLGTPD